MDILLVSATEMEINPFLMEGLSSIKKEINIDTLITGVGVPATIFHLTKSLTAKKYDYVVQAGIAGSYSKKLKKGSVCIVKSDVFGDLGISEKKEFKTLIEASFVDGNVLPYENGWLNGDLTFLKKSKLKEVTGVTINTITDNKKAISIYKKKYQASVESMEGAALHYTCILSNQPFVQMRSISNMVGERDKQKWDMKNALINLNEQLLILINSLSK